MYGISVVTFKKSNVVDSWSGCVGLLADDSRLQVGQRGSFRGGDDGVRFGVVGILQNVEESSSGVRVLILFIHHGHYILLTVL